MTQHNDKKAQAAQLSLFDVAMLMVTIILLILAVVFWQFSLACIGVLIFLRFWRFILIVIGINSLF